MNEIKLKYVSPQLEVIKMENEMPVMTGSNLSDMNVVDWGTTTKSAGARTRNYNSATSSDLEDMINDILTVGE